MADYKQVSTDLRCGEAARIAVNLWSPRADQLSEPIRERITACLSAAFSSNGWAESPMPIGTDSDPQSSRGIIATLGERAEILVASADECENRNDHIVACVLGTILDDKSIGLFGLSPYRARNGDGVLAYIGITPAAQGSRITQIHSTWVMLSGPAQAEREGVSLARLLFMRWLTLPRIQECPRLFIRTRENIGSIQYLARENGFSQCGAFTLEFRGTIQDRIVFRRGNPETPTTSF